MNGFLRGKKLLVLGGTRISCDIVNKAKEMGLYVCVADYNSKEDSPCKQICDEDFLVSCTDVDSIVELIKREKIDGVLTGFSDKLLPYYAEICAKANKFCYGTKDLFLLFTEKSKYKSLCRKFNVPVVEEYRISNSDFDDTKMKFPVLFKPSDDSGSRGLKICNTADELRQAINQYLSFGKRAFLVERYMNTNEVTVFWVFDDGKYYLTGIANRHLRQSQGEDVIPLPVGFTYPSSVLPKYIEEVEENAKKMFSSVGIKNGMMFMQCKVENGSCYVFDIGYRLTGSQEYFIYEDVFGYNTLEMMINYAITGKMGCNEQFSKIDPFFKNKYGFLVDCSCRPGTIHKLVGVEKVKKMPEVSNVYIAHFPGETILPSMRGLLAQVTYRVHCSVKNKDDIFEVMHKIDETLHIFDENGNDLILPGIQKEDLEGTLL